MFTFQITVPKDVLDACGGTVGAAMYGQLVDGYTPSAGPSSGQTLAAGSWVYYTGADYAVPNGSVPAFATYTSAEAQPLTLPDVQIASAHIVFGIVTLPTIPVDSAGAPQQPSPLTTGTSYDFIEFTYSQDTLYLNTTSIDQFGFPIQIQVMPNDAALPDGAGVTLDREDVFTEFDAYVANNAPAFVQCRRDPFGNVLTTRILSPTSALNANCVQGVVANAFALKTATLPAGTYFYAVTALDPEGRETYMQPVIVRATVETTGQAIQVAWAPNTSQPSRTASYNVYRGTPANDGTVTWGLIGNVLASQFPFGGAHADSGQPATPQTPPMNPLATLFDSQIKEFFTNYQSATLTLTATDGTNDGAIYTFQGQTETGGSAITALRLTIKSVTDASGKPVIRPLVPVGTPFTIFYPFWNTNTFALSNPAPPSWALYQTTPASVMVFAAQGVFADNAQQVANNLPNGITPNSDASTAYGVLLGALENQIVAAITRGIANSRTIAPRNWGNATAPVQTAPCLTPGTSSLLAGTPSYYVVTVTNANGETVGSFEFNATPTAEQPCVQVNWMPMTVAKATRFNVYRGTASMKENLLIAEVKNDGTIASYVDNGGSIRAQQPPAYFPPGIASSAYDAFFHQPTISINGASYAGPYDDQGGQSSTIATASPTVASVTLGPWGKSRRRSAPAIAPVQASPMGNVTPLGNQWIEVGDQCTLSTPGYKLDPNALSLNNLNVASISEQGVITGKGFGMTTIPVIGPNTPPTSLNIYVGSVIIAGADGKSWQVFPDGSCRWLSPDQIDPRMEKLESGGVLFADVDNQNVCDVKMGWLPTAPAQQPDQQLTQTAVTCYLLNLQNVPPPPPSNT
jgi:hypothetical protein